MTWRRTLLAALTVLTAGPPAAAEDRAVVVGIDAYGGAAGDAPLAGAVADAHRFRDLLTGPLGFEPSQVTLLENEAATSGAILDVLTDELLGQTRPGDRAVFYFAGLGAAVGRGAEEGTMPAIVAYDTEALLGRIPSDMFADLLDLMPDRQVLVVIDASFEGAPATADAGVRARGIAAEAGPEIPGALLFGQGQVARDVWNATRPSQVAWEDGGAGVFTSAFLDGVSGRADADADDQVSDAELLAFVVERTEAWCRANPACAGTELGFTPSFAEDVGPAAVPPPTVEPDGSDQDDIAGLVDLAREALASTDPAALRMSLEGPEPLRIGDTAVLRLEADQPGEVLLIELHAASGLQVLGAVPMPPDTKAEPLSLSFRATEPAGSGALIGILLGGNDHETDAMLPEVPTSEPSRFLWELGDNLRRLARDGGLEWSTAVLSYDVAP